MTELSGIHIAIAYLVIINVVTFFMYGIDKWRSAALDQRSLATNGTQEGRLYPKGLKKAKHAKWRVSEITLLMLAVIGGSIGAWLGMKTWHHKTLHKKFLLRQASLRAERRYGIPIIIILQVALLILTSCGTKKTMTDIQPIKHEHVPEHSSTVFLVMYDVEIGKEPLLKAIKDYEVEIIYDYRMMNGMALKKPDDKTLEETMAFFRKVKGVVSVEYDHVYHLTDPVKPKLETE